MDTLFIGAIATGPNADGTRFRVWHNEVGSATAEPFTELNRGNCISCAQAVAVYQQRPGVYRFSVLDYNDTLSTTSSRLSYAGAKLELYKGNARVATYYPPHKAGNLWTVFELEGDAIRLIDTMSAPAARCRRASAEAPHRCCAATAAARRRRVRRAGLDDDRGATNARGRQPMMAAGPSCT